MEKRMSAEEILAKLSDMLTQLNQEGREKLLEWGDVLTSCGKYSPGTVRIEWLRDRLTGGDTHDL